MTGSLAERNLLGAIVEEPRLHRNVQGAVSGLDFSDPRMGAVFDHVMALAASGEIFDAAIVDNRISGEWGIRGIPHGEVFNWVTADVVLTESGAQEYAASVRSDSLQRGLVSTSRIIHERLGDGVPAIDVATSASNELAELIDGAASGQLRTKSLEDILAGTDEYDWLIPDLIERQDRLVMTGAEGAGKTTFMRQIALLSAAGIHPIRFTPITPLNVLVVDAENTEKQWRRATRWLARRCLETAGYDPSPDIHIMSGHRLDIVKGPHLSEIHRLVDQHKPDILFIGPLYKLVSGAINNDDDAAPLIKALDSLRDRGLALIMEAHAGKGKDSSGNRDLAPRGSSALLGWPEFGMGMRPTETSPNVVELTRWRGDRDSREWPAHLCRGRDWSWEPTNYTSE